MAELEAGKQPVVVGFFSANLPPTLPFKGNSAHHPRLPPPPLGCTPSLVRGSHSLLHIV